MILILSQVEFNLAEIGLHGDAMQISRDNVLKHQQRILNIQFSSSHTHGLKVVTPEYVPNDSVQS